MRMLVRMLESSGFVWNEVEAEGHGLALGVVTTVDCFNLFLIFNFFSF